MMGTFVFDTATGRRIYRSLLERARLRTIVAWIGEFAGYGLLSYGAGQIYGPLGLIVLGGYIIVASNVLDGD